MVIYMDLRVNLSETLITNASGTRLELKCHLLSLLHRLAKTSTCNLS